MDKKLKEFTQTKFLHLVDHNGTIFHLLSPLSIYPDHRILTSFSSLKKSIQEINNLSKNKKLVVILHATGNKKAFYNMKEEIIKKFKSVYVFLHVSPKHFLIKNRINELKNLKKLVKEYNLKILTPSEELKKEFSYYDLNTTPIQLGVNFNPEKYHNLNSIKILKKYITTTCTSKEGIYNYIKGIDTFCKLAKNFGLEKNSIILGNNSNLFGGIKTKKVSWHNFLNYLNKSKVYIQFSRTEAYNLSAVYAKQLKIPIIVSNIEGHKNNVKYGFRVNNLKDAEKHLRNIFSKHENSKIRKIIEKNYKDSLKRESLNNFRNSFNKLLNS